MGVTQMNQLWYKRGIAFLMTVLLVVGIPFSPQVMASDGGIISISSEKDWADFVKKCKLDSWSKGKTVVLEADLNLNGKFRPVPIFCGSFDGNGHTIHIGTYTSSASDMGVFRYLAQGAEVKNLMITGTWTVSGSKNAIGGIVGSNRGTVSHSSFKGVIKGRNNIGGIAGMNEETGIISDCTALGKIEGEHYVGGIVGQNMGTVIKSRNKSNVNTTGEDIDPDLGEIDMSKLNSTENLSVYTDIGGIVGFSNGLLQECENFGKIGYPRIGYNVGGIAGRQSGQIQKCENKGEVFGRKDIGGIVGQMEPYLTLKFGKDDLERLLDAFSGLQNLIDGLIDDTQDTGDAFSARIHNISALTDVARENTNYLVKHTGDYVEESLLTINDLSKRADGFLYDMDRAMKQGDVLSKEIQDVFSQMHRTTDKMQDAASSGEDIFDHSKEGVDLLGTALDSYFDKMGQVKSSVTDVIQKVKNVLDALKQAVESIPKPKPPVPDPPTPPDGGGTGGDAKPQFDRAKEEIKVSLQQLLQSLKGVKEAISNWKTEGKNLRDSVKDAKGELEKALNSGSDMARELGASLARLDNAISEMEDVENKASDIVDRLESAVESFQEGGTPQFPVPSAKFREQSDELLDHTGAILDEVSALTDEMDAKGDILIEDLRAMNHQMGSIIDIMRDIYEALLDDDKSEDMYEDISDEVEASVEGVVEFCKNYGKVEGDVDIGGISGAIGIEYDFDPEDDLEKKGKRSLDLRYQTKAVLRSSINHGAVTGKKDYVGGIIGYMKLGSLYNCEAYGKVISENGNYVGGVAGQSDSVIRHSAAKVILEGGKYIGGITGQGTDIFDCGAMVDIQKADEGIGAIAGNAEGNFTGNRFVDCKWGGIDDISYEGKAEPMAYEDFIQLDGLPERFRSFYLTFIADGKVIADVAYDYGAKSDSQEIPKVPQKKGYTGKWEDLPKEVTFDRILEAVYTQNNSSIASKEKRSDGARAVMLAEGNFCDGANIELTPISEKDAAFTGDGAYAEGWKVKLPDDGNEEHIIRYCKPEGKGKLHLYLLKDSGIEKISAKKDGQYMCFPMRGNEFTIYSSWTSYAGIVVPICGAVAVLAILLLFKEGKKIRKFLMDRKNNRE